MSSVFDAPVGCIMAFAGPIANIPNDWHICDGRPLDSNAEPALFKAIGISWGGDGAPLFRLPDLRGQFLRGVDVDSAGAASQPTRDPERDDRAVANTAEMNAPGNSGNNVGSQQGFSTALPRRTTFHTDNPGDHSHLDPTWNGAAGPFELAVGAARGPGGMDYAPPGPTSPAGNHSHAVVGGGDRETRPNNAYVFWIIKSRSIG